MARIRNSLQTPAMKKKGKGGQDILTEERQGRSLVLKERITFDDQALIDSPGGKKKKGMAALTARAQVTKKASAKKEKRRITLLFSNDGKKKGEEGWTGDPTSFTRSEKGEKTRGEDGTGCNSISAREGRRKDQIALSHRVYKRGGSRKGDTQRSLAG